jgi:ligand-binding sensor domain-containing protein
MPFTKGFSAKEFYDGFIDKDNKMWFLTDQGLASGKLSLWVMETFNKKTETPEKDLKQFALQSSLSGEKVWFATPRGIIVADLPYETGSDLKVYNTGNSSIIGDSIIDIVTGPGNLTWIGTDKGVSGLAENSWLTTSYDDVYIEGFFDYFPITTMASTPGGDSLFVATRGAGVGRFYRNEVDGITGASTYAQWGPCVLPSDNVFCICINGDTQWYGTDKGLARHDGYEYGEGWTVYTTGDGLVDNFVKAIALDAAGKLWVGTRGGISVLDGSAWTSYSTSEGLVSNNILSIICDQNGFVYMGTDNGFMVYYQGSLFCFQ